MNGLSPPIRPVIRMEKLCRWYRMGDTMVHALSEVNIVIESGEFVAIIGPSGSGKSTLMNLIGCLDSASSGSYRLNGYEIKQASANRLSTIRNETIGFIFQGFNLLSRLTALENVELPLIYRGLPVRQRRMLAAAALEKVGLGDRQHHRPSELSGGQQQRVAIARAIVGDPPLMLADEPTGALDTRTGKEIMAMMQDLHAQGRTIVMITHDPDIAAQAERTIRIQDGQIVQDRRQNA